MPGFPGGKKTQTQFGAKKKVWGALMPTRRANCRNQVSMTGLRSQLSMKRGSTPLPVCSELRLFSREAITLKTPEAEVNE